MHSSQPKPEITHDPNLAAEQAQAQKSLVAGLQTQTQMDTSSLMARYGTTLALAGAGMSPLTPAATPPVLPSFKAA